MSDIVIFESDTQQVEVRLEGETLWLSLQQLAELFGRDKSVISRHLKSIFETNELVRDSVVAKNAITAEDYSVVRQESARQLKQGMMHELLTGRIRLV